MPGENVGDAYRGELVDAFSATKSHDLKNLFLAVGICSEQLIDMLPEGSEPFRAAEQIQKANDLATGLLHQLVARRSPGDEPGPGEPSERRRYEEALEKANGEFERSMQALTAELTRINATLTEEVVKRRKVERALRESEARYRAIIEVSGRTPPRHPSVASSGQAKRR